MSLVNNIKASHAQLPWSTCSKIISDLLSTGRIGWFQLKQEKEMCRTKQSLSGDNKSVHKVINYSTGIFFLFSFLSFCFAFFFRIKGHLCPPFTILGANWSSWIYWRFFSPLRACFETRLSLVSLSGLSAQISFSFCLWWWIYWWHILFPVPWAAPWCMAHASFSHDAQSCLHQR